MQTCPIPLNPRAFERYIYKDYSLALPVSISIQLRSSSLAYFLPFNQYNLSPFQSTWGSHPFFTKSPLACLNVTPVATLDEENGKRVLRNAIIIRVDIDILLGDPDETRKGVQGNALLP